MKPCPAVLQRSVFVVLASAVLLGAVAVAGGQLLWEDRFDGGGRDFVGADAIVAEGNRVFVVGSSQSENGNFDILVRAHDAKRGELLWQDQVDNPGDDSGLGVTVGNARVVVLGSFGTEMGSVPIIRTYDATTGEFLWQDKANSAIGNTFGRGAVAGSRVFAVGGFVTGSTDGDWLVRAYDAGTGRLLWQDRRAGGILDRALDVATGGGRVYVSGRDLHVPSGRSTFTVRAYDARTGELLWQDQQVPPHAPFTSAQAGRIAVEGGRVIAAGQMRTITFNPFTSTMNWYIRAFDAASGDLQWEDVANQGGTNFPDGVSDLAVLDGRAFVGGSGGPGCDNFVPSPINNCDFIVRAYDVVNGQPLWADRLDRAPADVVTSVAANGGGVFAVGFGGNDCTLFDLLNCDMLVRAYEPGTGHVVWDVQADAAGTIDLGNGVAVSGGKVFVVERLFGDGVTTSDDLLLQAYKADGVDDDVQDD